MEIKLCNKSRDTYDFISEYLDVIDYESYIQNQNLYQFCAYDNGILVGISIFRMLDGKIHMNYNAVSESKRGIGINKLMNNKIIEFAKENKCSIITVNTRSSNTSSIKSLLSSGFSINKSVKRFYPDGEEKISLFYRIENIKSFEEFKK